jgi:trehalose 6-phosphate synthase
VRYVNRDFSHGVLTGFYRQAQLGLVTPLRDGMNLVAKEFVASQDPQSPGVLVLSRFAGAAAEMKEALLVNPYDLDGVADAIAQAFAMPMDERIERWNALNKRLRRYDITLWRRKFLENLTS